MRAPAEKEQSFKKAYVNKRFKSITAEYGKLIDELARGVYDGRYNYGVLTDGDLQQPEEADEQEERETPGDEKPQESSAEKEENSQ